MSDRTLAAAIAATLGLAVALAVAIVGLAYRPAPAPTPARAPVQWQVYVSGAVVNPGIYSAQPGDRVADAIRAAGGPTQDADLEGVNPAMLLRDGLQVHVPRRRVIADP
ncbi:MAG TPA: SLBB domain-containing protein [Chloroflexota bacterium]